MKPRGRRAWAQPMEGALLCPFDNLPHAILHPPAQGRCPSPGDIFMKKKGQVRVDQAQDSLTSVRYFLVGHDGEGA